MGILSSNSSKSHRRSGDDRAVEEFSFRRRGRKEFIREGDSFVHKNGSAAIEVALVTDVYNDDRVGIPHVRYVKKLVWPGSESKNMGERVLSLDSFIDYFQKRMQNPS